MMGWVEIAVALWIGFFWGRWWAEWRAAKAAKAREAKRLAGQAEAERQAPPTEPNVFEEVLCQMQDEILDKRRFTGPGLTIRVWRDLATPRENYRLTLTGKAREGAK